MSQPVTIDEYSEWQTRLATRQTISRRSALKAVMTGAGGVASAQFGLAGVAFAAGGGRAGGAGVVVSGRHLSFVPGSDGVPRHAMAVTAQVVSKTGRLPGGLRVFVDVGTEAGRYGTRFDAPVQHLTGGYAIPGGPVGSQFYAKAKLTGLSPGTRYHYRFRLSDGTVTGDAHFTTAPDSGHGYHLLVPAKPFTFTAFADVGTNAAPTDPRHAWSQEPAVVTAAGGTWPAGIFDGNTYDSTDPIAGAGGRDPYPAATQTRLMDTQRPVFTLLAGDICYANPTGSGLPADDSEAMSRTAPKGRNLFNPYVWDVFLDQIEPQAAFTPWMFTTGNHDMEPLYGNTEFLGGSPNHGYGGHLARLDLPGNGPHTCPSVYRFRYANVGVVSIDANELSAEVRTNTGYSDGAQLAWIERTLREWRTERPVASDIDFIVAFFHHCAFSTTNNHASDGGVRAALEPLFSKYQVDLAVQGHNHLMERTDPIRNGVRTRAAPDGSTIHPARDGVTYLCVGSGGRPRYPFRDAPGPAAPPPPGVTPKGAQSLAAGQRYRGYRPPGGENRTENNTANIVNSYVWSHEKSTISRGGHPMGSRIPEAVDWSQVRYDAYAFIAVDVVPALRGGTTTLTVRTLADALPGSVQPYTEIDRITLARTSGAALV